jgi:phenylpropionate dioxygenase-like ring-hydroxylating dioxygenase large terminal subunit
VPDERDFVGLCRDERSLRQLSCEVWEGWVFVNQLADAPSLSDHLGSVLDEMTQFAGESLSMVSARSQVVTCNWKVTAEAFLEVYHFRHIHSRGSAAKLDSRGATMGLLPNGCSRMVTPFSKAACGALGMRDWSDWRRFDDDPFVDIPTVNEMVRSTSTAYGLFPNLITPVAQSGFPILLFWPLDKRTTRLEWIHYAPTDWDGDALPSHWVERLERFDQVMDEDIRNMAPMQHSLESPAIRGIPINYQERRIWHFNEQVDRVIGPERILDELRVPPLLADYVESRPGAVR